MYIVCPVITQNIHSTTRMLSVMVKEVLCNVTESLDLLNLGAKRVPNSVLYNHSRHRWSYFIPSHACMAFWHVKGLRLYQR